jgi:hypothetical protein
MYVLVLGLFDATTEGRQHGVGEDRCTVLSRVQGLEVGARAQEVTKLLNLKKIPLGGGLGSAQDSLAFLSHDAPRSVNQVINLSDCAAEVNRSTPRLSLAFLSPAPATFLGHWGISSFVGHAARPQS